MQASMREVVEAQHDPQRQEEARRLIERGKNYLDLQRSLAGPDPALCLKRLSDHLFSMVGEAESLASRLRTLAATARRLANAKTL